MNNLIFNAFAFKNDYHKVPNVSAKDEKNIIDIYFKNIFVSLKSAKISNPFDDVALITNYRIPENFQRLYEKNNILIFYCDFKNFCMPKDFKWALAFYKLCALKFIVDEAHYDNYLLLDSDTVTTNSYVDLWEEAQFGLMLFDVNHTFFHNVRNEMIKTYNILYNYTINIQQYGGEFICGSKGVLQEFVKKLDEVYYTIKSNKFNISKSSGDELIISIAATKMSKVFNSGAYIDRYWTEKFYLASTNYINDPVAILHLPGEKESGIISLYNYLIKNESLPRNIYKILGLPKAKRPDYLIFICKKLAKKLLKGVK